MPEVLGTAGETEDSDQKMGPATEPFREDNLKPGGISREKTISYCVHVVGKLESYRFSTSPIYFGRLGKGILPSK